MPANKNALIRYKTIDNCLRNRYRRWTLDDLVDACSEALYDMEGIRKGVSVRTVQGDIQVMRSDKLGYNAPIEVYDHKYYRYADKDYSIMDMPMSQNDYEVMQEAVDMLRQLEDFGQFSGEPLARQVGHQPKRSQAHHSFRQCARLERHPPVEPIIQLHCPQADVAHHVSVVLGTASHRVHPLSIPAEGVPQPLVPVWF